MPFDYRASETTPVTSLLRGLLPACVLLVAACPGKDGLLTEFQETSGSTTDASTATGATTDVSATGTTGGPDLCQDPSIPPDQIGPAVMVTVRNTGAADIFVAGHGFCDEPAFTVSDVDDNKVTVWNGADCPPMCGSVFESGQCGCNDIGCTPGAIRIVPGGALVDAWSGERYDAIQPAAECVPAECVGQSCSVRRQTDAGAYNLTARASASVTCPSGDCTCEPNAEGWCVVSDAQFDPITTVVAPLDYPTDVAVELVFE